LGVFIFWAGQHWYFKWANVRAATGFGIVAYNLLRVVRNNTSPAHPAAPGQLYIYVAFTTFFCKHKKTESVLSVFSTV
jgi:hypothetical protein